ncbi:MAG: hypothetical protein KAG64_01200 [Bacteroidales bacterium]|nr:hypothetical protein [Bacteroidales bacterium]
MRIAIVLSALLFVLMSFTAVDMEHQINSNDSSVIIVDNAVDSQQSLQILIDSIVDSEAYNTKAILCLKIAWELKSSDWDRCSKYIDNAEFNAKKYNKQDFLIAIYTDIADLYYDKDLLDISLKYYTNAYNLYDKNNSSSEKHDLENDIAIIYAKLKKTDQAFYFFQRVYIYKNKLNDTLGIAKLYNNLGLLFFETNIDSSIYYFEKSLDLVYQIDNKILSVYVFTNIAKCYSILGNTARTDFYSKKALSFIDDVPQNVKAWVYKTVSEEYFQRNKIDSCIYYANKSKDILKSNKYTFSYLDLNRTLYKAYLEKEDYKKASMYFVIYDQIRDSLNIEQKAVNAEKIKLEQEFIIKDQIRDLEESKRKNKNIIISFGLIVSLFVLIILLTKNKSRLQKSKLEKKLIEAKRDELNQDLESKKGILIAKAMKEIHRTEFIQDILIDLKEIKLKAVKKETQQAIEIIQKRLEKGTSNNIWEEFELSLEQVHKRFFSNLTEKHPTLTSKDKRLCALLVLNLTSKEIAQITGQDFKTVENARTRLRKKLNLTNTKTDLIVYLNELK